MTEARATTENRRIVVLGGGVAGLAAAIALARRGLPVTVIERDPPPPPGDGFDPFLAWKRRGVPQFRLPHGFSARTRNLLARHAPDVLDRLGADGIEVINLFKRLIPEELWVPSDDDYANLWARRAAFELALRRTAEAQDGIGFVCPAVAAGLAFERTPDGTPRVTGVRLAGGRELPAGLVLDCGGQRTPLPRWLAAEGVHVEADDQDCQTVYFSRYYRFTPDCDLPKTAVATLRGELDGIAYIGFPGDHDTFAICFEGHPGDEDMRLLRHTWAFEAAAAAIPAVAPWVDPANGTPLDDVQIMGGHHNVRRHYVVDGRPLVLGLLPVGDSLCTTNPAYGWGAAMALTYAFAAAEAVGRHGGDLTATALAYENAIASEADAVFRESAAMDRARIYRITGREVPEHDRLEMERQQLILEGLSTNVLLDIELGRAFCRRVNLVGPADAVLGNPELAIRAGRRRDLEPDEAPEPPLGRDELRAVIEAARPAATV
ncbi:NAD(P)/FAD-dependent oxidoreductase [Actinomadura roseirufa]|uniref:NAD(P)/FAD-dependent oxidoreductase n=1 Tax=Actinomadura roseirufa TaxID=2094049 RepID=UPI001F5EE4B8|nr:FAD-dependent oxidoreductase [Actinomadura roseirufa]